MTPCTFVQITDHHLPDDESGLTGGYSSPQALSTVLRHIAAHAPADLDFLISTGDVVDVPSAASYQHACRLLRARPASDQTLGDQLVTLDGARGRELPMYFVPGNHDDRDQFFRWLVPRVPPRPLHNFAFEYRGVQFIGLDWGPAGRGYAHAEMLAFLARALERNLPAVLFTHYHLVPVGISWVDALIAENVSELWPILRGKRVLGIFSGHAHCTYESAVDGIPLFGLRSTAPQFARTDTMRLRFDPPHYRIARIEHGVLTTRIVEVPV